MEEDVRQMVQQHADVVDLRFMRKPGKRPCAFVRELLGSVIAKQSHTRVRAAVLHVYSWVASLKIKSVQGLANWWRIDLGKSAVPLARGRHLARSGFAPWRTQTA